jgi:hypothetical protein
LTAQSEDYIFFLSSFFVLQAPCELQALQSFFLQSHFFEQPLLVQLLQDDLVLLQALRDNPATMATRAVSICSFFIF